MHTVIVFFLTFFLSAVVSTRLLVLASPEHGLADGHAERDDRLLEQELAAAVGDDGGRKHREGERAVLGAGALLARSGLGVGLDAGLVGSGRGDEGGGGGFTERVSSRAETNNDFTASTGQRGSRSRRRQRRRSEVGVEQGDVDGVSGANWAGTGARNRGILSLAT